METNFIIRFSPESKSDYNYDIIVETEREKFVVPIVAVGKRAMIGMISINQIFLTHWTLVIVL